MFLAHLPAGYLLSHALLRLSRTKPRKATPILALGLFGSIAPDLDLIWHAYFDPTPVFHHYYWTHYPFAWAVFTLPLLLGSLALGQRTWALGALVFAANGFGHMLLDTLWGRIGWAWPFDPTLFRWVSVPSNHRFWVLNFVWHWTALVELSIIAAAATLFWLKRRPSRAALPLRPSGSGGRLGRRIPQ